MRHVCLALAAVAVLAAGLGDATAFTVPTDWSSNPYYTQQTWSFGSNANPANADVGYINTNGTPTVTVDNAKATWYASGAPWGFGYSGIYNVAGPSAKTDSPPIATFTIPVTAESLTSAIYVDTVLQTNDPNFAADLALTAHTNGQDYYSGGNINAIPINPSYGIYEVQMLYQDIPGFTAPLTMNITGNLTAGLFVNFDYITVSTVPEPGSIAMLIASTLAVLGWAGWRRWR